MKFNTYINAKSLTFVFALLAMTSCERELSSDVEFAEFPSVGEIFTDTPVGLGSDFYFPFLGSKLTAFSVDNEESYQGNASMRIDVPNESDPAGNYAGAIFRIEGSGRNLTEFDALTFWGKASQGVVIGEMGFGQDFEENKFQTTVTNLSFTTNWVKYTIPIPDASKLIEERGMLWYSAGTQNTGGLGYTFWLDEVKFEKLGTLAQPQPAIFNGDNLTEQSFTGSTRAMTGLTQTFNLGSGENVTVITAPSYFDFSSSDIEIARVSELGEISVIAEGVAEITAILGGVLAEGSLTLNVGGPFVSAPIPPIRNEADVISIFSDAYANVSNLNIAIFNDSDVQIQTQIFNNDEIISYENLSFVGLGWDGTSNVTGMTHLHLDIQVTSATNPDLIVELIDFGADNVEGGGDDTGGGSTVSSQLIEGTWVGIDIPIDAFIQATGGGFGGSPNLANISRVVLVSNDGSFLVDNIYFYNE